MNYRCASSSSGTPKDIGYPGRLALEDWLMANSEWAKGMKTTQEYISTLKQHAPVLRERFGMTSMLLFGSVARGEQREDSDVDVLVDMPATLRGVGGANSYLEQVTGKHVDMILMCRNLTPFFLKEVERDGITIF